MQKVLIKIVTFFSFSPDMIFPHQQHTPALSESQSLAIGT